MCFIYKFLIWLLLFTNCHCVLKCYAKMTFYYSSRRRKGGGLLINSSRNCDQLLLIRLVRRLFSCTSQMARILNPPRRHGGLWYNSNRDNGLPLFSRTSQSELPTEYLKSTSLIYSFNQPTDQHRYIRKNQIIFMNDKH